MKNNNTKTPKSQLDWQATYDKKNMKVTGIKHSITERQQWEDAANKNQLNLSLFVRRCVKYCIENNIDLKEFK